MTVFYIDYDTLVIKIDYYLKIYNIDDFYNEMSVLYDEWFINLDEAEERLKELTCK